MRSAVLAVLLLLSAFVDRSHADLLLTLSSTSGDLSSLNVGQTIEIQMSLSGLGDSGNPTQISALTADVGFSSTLFSTPFSVTPGALVPNAVLSFTPVETAGTAGGIFDNIFLPPPAPVITSNGVFLTFQVTALSAGSGVFSLAPPPGAFDDLGGEVSVMAGSDLPFTVTGGGAVIPEPSTMLLLGLGLVGIAWRRRMPILRN